MTKNPTTVYLLDANILIPLADRGNSHHESAITWLGVERQFAVCPITEGALVRHLVRVGASGRTASGVVRQIRSMPRAQFWPADLSYADLELDGVYGHRQVTDSYLVGLVRHHPGARMATYDRALALSATDVVDLIDFPR